MSQNEWIKGPEPLSEILPNTNKRFKQKVTRAFISESAQALDIPDPYEQPIKRATLLYPNPSNQRRREKRQNRRAEKRN